MHEAGINTKIIDGAKTSGDLITQTNTPIFGVAVDKWNSVSLVDGTNHAGFYRVDINNLVPQGVRIGRGSADHLAVVIKDNLTGLTDFTVRALGYSHFPPSL